MKLCSCQINHLIRLVTEGSKHPEGSSWIKKMMRIESKLKDLIKTKGFEIKIIFCRIIPAKYTMTLLVANPSHKNIVRVVVMTNPGASIVIYDTSFLSSEVDKEIYDTSSCETKKEEE